MAGVTRTKNKHGEWRCWYNDPNAEPHQQWFWATKDRRKSKAIAQQKEAQARDRAANPDRSDTPAAEVMAAFFAWGEFQGGKHKRGWKPDYVRVVEPRVRWWLERLALETIGDLAGRLVDVEDGIRELAKSNAPKTVREYGAALHRFARWAVGRSFLGADPLAGLELPRGDPQVDWRALEREEIAALLKAAPLDRRLTYLVAILTGFRVNELRNLRVRHLHAASGELEYEGTWTKNGKSGRQPIPGDLARLLARSARGKVDTDALLWMPPKYREAKVIKADCSIAGITLETDRGKVVFHSTRDTFSTLLDRFGASKGEQTALMRQAPDTLAQRRYTDASPERMRAVLGRLWEAIEAASYAEIMQIAPTGDAMLSITAVGERCYDKVGWGDQRDSNPQPPEPQSGALTKLSYGHRGWTPCYQNAPAPSSVGATGSLCSNPIECRLRQKRSSRIDPLPLPSAATGRLRPAPAR